MVGQNIFSYQHAQQSQAWWTGHRSQMGDKRLPKCFLYGKYTVRLLKAHLNITFKSSKIPGTCEDLGINRQGEAWQVTLQNCSWRQTCRKTRANTTHASGQKWTMVEISSVTSCRNWSHCHWYQWTHTHTHTYIYIYIYIYSSILRKLIFSLFCKSFFVILNLCPSLQMN